MLTDRQLIELVQRTNPVPDPERVPPPRHDALTLLEVAGKEPAMKTHPRVESPPATEAPRPRRWLRPALAFVVALVLVLGAVGVIALISGDEAEVADDPIVTTTVPAMTVTEAPVAPTTSPPATTATTAPEPPPQSLADVFAGGTWTQAVGEAGFWIHRLVPTSLGLFATDGQSIMMSPDGLKWDVVFTAPFEPLDPQPTDSLPAEAPLGRIEGGVGPIVEFKAAVYAFGAVGTDLHSGRGRIDRYAWRSENGTSWEQIPLPPTRVDEGSIDRAVALDDRIVAFLAWGGGSPVWVSGNGLDWEVAESEQTGIDDLAVSSVIPHGGGLLAVGDVYEPEEARFTFTSPDGEVWKRGYRFGADEFPVSSAREVDGTLYLGGYTFDQASDADITPAVWRSHDGITFERLNLPAEILGNSPQLVMTDFGILGVVSMRPYESDEPWPVAFLALEADGEFSPIDPGAPASLTNGVNLWDVTYFDGKLILVGRQFEKVEPGRLEGGIPHTWIWSPGS